MFRPRKRIGRLELQEKINSLNNLYKPMDLNGVHHRDKIMAISKLNQILNNTRRRDIQESDFKELLLCSLTVLYYFGLRLKLNGITSKYWHWWSKRNFVKAEITFQKTIDSLLPELSELTIKIVLNFFTAVCLWPFETFVSQVLDVILYFTRGDTILFNLMLTDLQFKDLKSARHRVRVLYQLLNSSNWVIEKHKLLPFVTRLLDFFTNSIVNSDNKLSTHKYIRAGFEVCLRRICKRVENAHRIVLLTTMLNRFSMFHMMDDNVLDFFSLLDYAAVLYEVKLYTESFRNKVFESVLENLVSSDNALHCLVGSRLLLRFLDRQKNSAMLHVPTLYYNFSNIRLKVGEYDSSDKIFIREKREDLHENIIKAVRLHCDNIINLKALFSIIGCIVLEVPCGFTAATAACMMMALQDFALNGDDVATISRYWMHAIVVSIMSLICWVHKAPVLYSYVYEIIARRAKEAPHLNPPIMVNYNIGHHHVTWNKPTLFFEDWELRYGLWKHFHNARPIIKIIPNKTNKKIPTIDVMN